ncbi:MAG: HD domain-containing protein [bacterium]|nr:HD domain-containing protein [bacterium]
MLKQFHKIRDPIHGFIQVETSQLKVLDSRAFQRLRYIHQLGMTYLVYPGATHKRFEHSLGVMELAGRVFDIISSAQNIHPDVKPWLPELGDQKNLDYWRNVIRVAALCHDIGHMPFSHTAERELLPKGWNHERISRNLILSDEMKAIWSKMDPPLEPEDVVRLSIGPKEEKELEFTRWQSILSEVITGDAFGVDRMDYLLRDSFHSGVAYGRFDHYRLIDTLRILPPPQTGEGSHQNSPTLGITEGGIQSAEALLLARYFMFSQVYLHPVRRIYDIHLKDFLGEWLGDKKYPTDLEGHLALTDSEIITAVREALKQPGERTYAHAHRLMSRGHFKLLYQRNPEDMALNPEASAVISEEAKKKFGSENVRADFYEKSGSAPDFPVLLPDGRVTSALSLSQPMNHIPTAASDYICIHPECYKEALAWLKKHRKDILAG